MKRVKHENKKYVLHRMAFPVALLVAILAVGYPVVASGPDISDTPLETMVQTAPGIIMFVLDDSGSMDWSFMCPTDEEEDGKFDGYEYIFDNNGDDLSGSDIESSSTTKMMWISQWAGYNGMYYDPDTDYTPWPTLSNADIDAPRSYPTISGNSLSMTRLWYQWDGAGTVVDNDDAGFSESGSWSSDSHYLYSGSDNQDYTATWTLSVDTSKNYNVYARWVSSSNRSNAVHYRTYDGANEIVDTSVDQRSNGEEWMSIASGVQFSSGTAKVQINQRAVRYELCADAVMFVPLNDESNVSNIARRHYYVKGTDDLVYLVNLLGGVIEYYRVNLDDVDNNREVVTYEKLTRLTDDEAGTAGIVTGRTYTEECQNFANWYSFYRRRELSAKNGIARVINSIDGVYVGLIFINNYNSGIYQDTAAKPVRFNDNGTIVDESADLLDILYGYTYEYQSTPLRNGLNKAGRFYAGDYLKPSDADLPSHTTSDSYPYFKEEEGGSCQMAFTIIFADGYYNCSFSSVGNTDGPGDGDTDFDGVPFGDNYSNTLADVAMKYYEDDLNSYLTDSIHTSTVDTAGHQYMVTYTIAFGVTGTLATTEYEDCPHDPASCPTWPNPHTESIPSAGDPYGKFKIDDMFHAAVNGRGKHMSPGNTQELNDALDELQEEIEDRLGAASGLFSSSIQRTAGTKIYQATFNPDNWQGEIRAHLLDAETGDVSAADWNATDKLPDWDDRNILSYKDGSGIVFAEGNLSDAQRGQLVADAPAPAEQIVNFIRGDQSNSSLRNRTKLIGDIDHSAPTYCKGSSGGTEMVYVGANDGMLHAFNASTGIELFAYVPGLVYDHLGELANPNYSHKYYVDGTPRVVNVGGRYLLVCGLNKGGKGYFALDVTDPTAMTPSNVLWEFSGADDDSGNDMGYSFSRPMIVNTENDGWVVIFGNGYDSVNGEAILYVLDADDGTVLKKIHTGAVGANGLSEPAVIDLNSDGYPDFIYAGDLKGNMWKFDTRGDVSFWDVFYQDGGSPMPMVTVRSSSNQAQPITSAPEAMIGCQTIIETDDDDVLNRGRGLMVFFGTGQYLNHDDFSDTTTVQSLYGIWDWGLVWEASDGKDKARGNYLGTLDGDRSLTRLGMGSAVGLVKKTAVASSTWYTVTDDYTANDNEPAWSWYDPWNGDSEGKMGWVLDLPDTGERILEQPIVRSGIVIAVSYSPSSSACDSSGKSTIWSLDACKGGNPRTSFWDVDGDGDVDDDDKIGDPLVPPAGKKYDTFIPKVLIKDNIMYFPNIDDPDNPIGQEDIGDDPVGMFYWRILER